MSRTVRPTQNRWLYGLFSMAADQTSNWAMNNHAEFDTKDSGDLIISTGVGQAKGKVTLPGGHRYRIMVNILCQAQAGLQAFVPFKIYDVTNAAYLTNTYKASSQSTNYATTMSHKGTSEAEIYVEDTIQIEARFTAALANMLRLRYEFSFIEIQEIPK